MKQYDKQWLAPLATTQIMTFLTCKRTRVVNLQHEHQKLQCLCMWHAAGWGKGRPHSRYSREQKVNHIKQGKKIGVAFREGIRLNLWHTCPPLKKMGHVFIWVGRQQKPYCPNQVSLKATCSLFKSVFISCLFEKEEGNSSSQDEHLSCRFKSIFSSQKPPYPITSIYLTSAGPLHWHTSEHDI